MLSVWIGGRGSTTSRLSNELSEIKTKQEEEEEEEENKKLELELDDSPLQL